MAHHSCHVIHTLISLSISECVYLAPSIHTVCFGPRKTMPIVVENLLCKWDERRKNNGQTATKKVSVVCCVGAAADVVVVLVVIVVNNNSEPCQWYFHICHDHMKLTQAYGLRPTVSKSGK